MGQLSSHMSEPLSVNVWRVWATLSACPQREHRWITGFVCRSLSDVALPLHCVKWGLVPKEPLWSGCRGPTAQKLQPLEAQVWRINKWLVWCAAVWPVYFCAYVLVTFSF